MVFFGRVPGVLSSIFVPNNLAPATGLSAIVPPRLRYATALRALPPPSLTLDREQKQGTENSGLFQHHPQPLTQSGFIIGGGGNNFAK